LPGDFCCTGRTRHITRMLPRSTCNTTQRGQNRLFSKRHAPLLAPSPVTGTTQWLKVAIAFLPACGGLGSTWQLLSNRFAAAACYCSHFCCVAAVTGPGTRGCRQLDLSGGVLADTWMQLLLFTMKPPEHM
jgi:hypothetical protein